MAVTVLYEWMQSVVRAVLVFPVHTEWVARRQWTVRWYLLNVTNRVALELLTKPLTVTAEHYGASLLFVLTMLTLSLGGFRPATAGSLKREVACFGFLTVKQVSKEGSANSAVQK